jgi:hypothetical protein
MKRHATKAAAKNSSTSRRPRSSAKHAPLKRKSGRYLDPRPKDSFEAWLLSDYGPKIAPFLHRSRDELREVHYAAVFGAYPLLTKREEDEIRERLRIEQLPEAEISQRLKMLRSTRSRDRLALLLLQRCRECDTEFFELLAMVLAHRRTGVMSERAAAICYITVAEADGFTPSKNGFVKWLRDYAGVDVVKEARGYGQHVVHPETAARAFKFVTAYRIAS